jgi:hypothetical protein
MRNSTGVASVATGSVDSGDRRQRRQVAIFNGLPVVLTLFKPIFVLQIGRH